MVMVASLPKRLRYFLDHEPVLIGPVLRIFLETVEDRLKARSSDAAVGLLRDGGLLSIASLAPSANLHFHCVVIDGVFGAQGERVQFARSAAPSVLRTSAPMRRAQAASRVFARRGLIPSESGRRDAAMGPRGWLLLDAGVRIEAADSKGWESQGQGWPWCGAPRMPRLLCYCARPALSVSA